MSGLPREYPDAGRPHAASSAKVPGPDPAERVVSG